MRVFFVEWAESFHLELAKEAKLRGWDAVGWTGDPRSGIDFKALRMIWPEVIVLSTEECLRAQLPPELAFPETPPETLFRQLSECESIVLKMMNRMDYSGVSISVVRCFAPSAGFGMAFSAATFSP